MRVYHGLRMREVKKSLLCNCIVKSISKYMWSMIIFLKNQLVSFLHKNVPSAEEKIKIAEGKYHDGQNDGGYIDCWISCKSIKSLGAVLYFQCLLVFLNCFLNFFNLVVSNYLVKCICTSFEFYNKNINLKQNKVSLTKVTTNRKMREFFQWISHFSQLTNTQQHVKNFFL